MTQPTPYPDVNELLQNLLGEIQKNLGDKLVGFYLYGSLVWGDFDHDCSDIDLLAALAMQLNDQETLAIQHMHEDFAARYKTWDNRIEVQYFSLVGLKTFRFQSHPMGNISPGEPFHVIQAGIEWLMNWYFVRENGVTLYGPPPGTLIDPISKEEFIHFARAYAQEQVDNLPKRKSLPGQAYAILSMCRALYTHTTGEQVSKKKAAEWAAACFPDWAHLIQNALIWRKGCRNSPVTGDGMYPETERFVHFMIAQVFPREN